MRSSRRSDASRSDAGRSERSARSSDRSSVRSDRDRNGYYIYNENMFRTKSVDGRSDRGSVRSGRDSVTYDFRRTPKQSPQAGTPKPGLRGGGAFTKPGYLSGQLGEGPPAPGPGGTGRQHDLDDFGDPATTQSPTQIKDLKDFSGDPSFRTKTPLLSGQAFDTMVYTPRAGYSRTVFGGIWEDHKPQEGMWPRALNHCGFSDFDPDEPTDTSTYKYHFSLFYDGEDTAGYAKPNRVGTATATRGINGYERNDLGGFFQRHAYGDPKQTDMTEAFRAIPPWSRKLAEPTRPGPGYTRTDMGGFFQNVNVDAESALLGLLEALLQFKT